MEVEEFDKAALKPLSTRELPLPRVGESANGRGGDGGVRKHRFTRRSHHASQP